MLGLGMASAHAPMMFQKAQYWPRMLERIPAEAREHLPKSARVELATPAIVDGYIQRIEAAFATLRAQLEAFRPDALIMIGDDQCDMFDDANNPTSEWAWTKKAATVSFRNPRRDSTFYLDFDARPDLFNPPQQITVSTGGQVLATFAADSKEKVTNAAKQFNTFCSSVTSNNEEHAYAKVVLPVEFVDSSLRCWLRRFRSEARCLCGR